MSGSKIVFTVQSSYWHASFWPIRARTWNVEQNWRYHIQCTTTCTSIKSTCSPSCASNHPSRTSKYWTTPRVSHAVVVSIVICELIWHCHSWSLESDTDEQHILYWCYYIWKCCSCARVPQQSTSKSNGDVRCDTSSPRSHQSAVEQIIFSCWWIWKGT